MQRYEREIEEIIHGSAATGYKQELRRKSSKQLLSWHRSLFYIIGIFLLIGTLLFFFWYKNENSSYQADIPGPGCDHGFGQWTKGNTHTEHQIEVDDPYTTLTCRSDGLLITRTGSYNVFGTVFFRDTYHQISKNYRVQLTAQIRTGDSNATVELGVHGQSHYGADSFQINTQGEWQVVRFKDTDGTVDSVLASGTLLHLAQPFVVTAEVYGPAMAFMINRSAVATVSDTKYPTSASVSFGTSDSTAKTPSSTLFSHFIYKPLSTTASSIIPVPVSDYITAAANCRAQAKQPATCELLLNLLQKPVQKVTAGSISECTWDSQDSYSQGIFYIFSSTSSCQLNEINANSIHWSAEVSSKSDVVFTPTLGVLTLNQPISMTINIPKGCPSPATLMFTETSSSTKILDVTPCPTASQPNIIPTPSSQ